LAKSCGQDTRCRVHTRRQVSGPDPQLVRFVNVELALSALRFRLGSLAGTPT
jgi:hypothetical protein